jgi:hypothetical protein
MVKFTIGFILGIAAHYVWCKYGNGCDCNDKIKWSKKK